MSSQSELYQISEVQQDRRKLFLYWADGHRSTFHTASRYCLKQGLQPGDLVMFDNHRVLHGRTAIGRQNKRRHLRYCSVDRDYFRSLQWFLDKNLSFQE